MMILEKPEHYRNWEQLSLHCETLDGLTRLEKEKAKRAFQSLSGELGEKFLHYAFDAGHPICQYILNMAPWTRKWITWLSEAIRELKVQDNYPSLLARIKDKDKFPEGLSVLEVAYKFSKVGFSVCFDPAVAVSGKTKIPDLGIVGQDNRERFFVEVATCEQSRIQKEAFRTMHKITDALWRSVPFMHYCAHIHKTLAERHSDDLVKRIAKMVEKAKEESVFQELIVEDVIEIGIAPENDMQFLEKWARERGLNVGQFLGPPFDVNEILRTKRKIENEQKQLPHEYPNILVVRNNGLFSNIRDIRKAISELEEEVYAYPHLLAAVITGQHIGSGENKITMQRQHVFIKKTKADLLSEQYIILLNEYCDPKISASAITKTYNAFRNY